MIIKVDISVANDGPVNDVREFLASGWEVAEIDIGKYRDTNAARCTYKYAVQVYGEGRVALVQRRKRLFLMRKDVNESDRHI